MPHLMNCPHSEDGWCLDCVREQWEELDKLKERARIFYSQIEKIRGNEHWDRHDERSFELLGELL
jgi:hypothetical protein